MCNLIIYYKIRLLSRNINRKEQNRNRKTVNCIIIIIYYRSSSSTSVSIKAKKNYSCSNFGAMCCTNKYNKNYLTWLNNIIIMDHLNTI